MKNLRYQDALLVCLQIRECDVVGVERAVFERWKAAGEPVQAFLESKPVPGISVAVKQSLAATPTMRALQPVLLRTLATQSLSRNGFEKPVAIEKREFDYVSTLGYFTPRQLPGATVVDAVTVARLMTEGATYFDTRTEAEFKAGHVPGAKWLPYVEKSAKDTDYDTKLDTFDTASCRPTRRRRWCLPATARSAGKATRPATPPSRPATARCTGSAAACPSGAPPSARWPAHCHKTCRAARRRRTWACAKVSARRPAGMRRPPRETAVCCRPAGVVQDLQDSTFAMMREAARRGHTLMACEPKDLLWQRGEPVTGFVRDITLTGDADAWFSAAQQHPHEPRKRRPQPLKDVDAVLMRKDPPFDPEYFYATHLLSQAEREGARIFNKPSALREHPGKARHPRVPAVHRPDAGDA